MTDHTSVNLAHNRMKTRRCMAKFVPSILSLMILVSGCGGLRLNSMSANEKAERLAIEKGKLFELKNPLQRAKSHIAISHILLSFTSDAIRDRDIEAVPKLLDLYVMAIQSARGTMVDSERNVEQTAGYKDLEIALRGQTMLLEDMGRQLRADERGPVDRATAVATSVRNEILRLLSLPAD